MERYFPYCSFASKLFVITDCWFIVHRLSVLSKIIALFTELDSVCYERKCSSAG